MKKILLLFAVFLIGINLTTAQEEKSADKFVYEWHDNLYSANIHETKKSDCTFEPSLSNHEKQMIQEAVQEAFKEIDIQQLTKELRSELARQLLEDLQSADRPQAIQANSRTTPYIHNSTLEISPSWYSNNIPYYIDDLVNNEAVYVDSSCFNCKDKLEFPLTE